MKRALVLGFSLLTTGCFSCGYLSQAGVGEAKLLLAAKPIAKVRRDPKTPPRIAELLGHVAEIKAFGQAHGLRPTKNYTRYADLHRDAAVWVVEACAELSFSTKRWHFPIAGSVPYLGFFHEKDARRYAARLAKQEHLDVEVRTAGAFSTLGWFRDPVLSTMIPDGPEALGELANVVLHESVHATIYLPGQSAFNESFASFVADRLTVEWLDANAPAQAAEWTALEESYRKRIERLHAAYVTLDEIYRSSRPDEEKRAAKREVFLALQDELHLSREINNATLAGYRTYDTGGPAFARLFDACSGDWPKFLGAIRSLTAKDFPRAQAEDFDATLDAAASRCR